MSNPLDAPSDGPAEILAEAVRRRGSRYSRTHVRALLAHQERPQSLLALVRSAPELGFEATAGQGDLETLEALDADELPALLHFTSESQGGFGLLEAVSPAGPDTPLTFHLWDRQGGHREMTGEALGACWSGVVVLLERRGAGAPEPGYLLHRAREWLLEEWKPRTALAGAASSRGMRLGLAMLLGGVLVGAVLAQAPGLRVTTALLALFGAVGLAASLAALSWVPGTSSALCPSQGPINCESVLRSPWARPAGVPLAGLGTAFFGSLLLLLGTSGLGGGSAPVWLVGAAFLPTLPLSAGLVGVQVRMRRLCTLCMAVHAANVGGSAVFLAHFAPGALAPPPGVLPAVLLGALFFGVLMSCLVPLVSRGSTAETAAEEHSRLLRSPLATLARLSQQPRLAPDGETLGVRWGSPEAPHELVVFAHPACVHCGHLLEQLEAERERWAARLRLCIALSPMDLEDAGDVAACEALVAAGVAWGGEAFLGLLREAKRDYARLRLAEAPFALVAAGAGHDPGPLWEAREQARARIRTATRFKLRHVRGLPGLYLDGRRCEAPWEHVLVWLDSPSLLEVLSSRVPPSEDTGAHGAAHP